MQMAQWAASSDIAFEDPRKARIFWMLRVMGRVKERPCKSGSADGRYGDDALPPRHGRDKNENPLPPRSPSLGPGIRSPCGKRKDSAQGAGILLPGGSALQIFIPQAFFANFHGFLSYSRHFPRANDKMVTGFRKLNSFSLPAPSGSSFGDHSDRQGATGSKRWKRWNCRESEVSELVRRDFA